MAEPGSPIAEVEAPATVAVEEAAPVADVGSSDVPASNADTQAAAESGPAAVAASADDATKAAASPSASPAGKNKKDRKKANKAAAAAAATAGDTESNGDAEPAAVSGKCSDADAAANVSSAADTTGETAAAPATTSPAAAAKPPAAPATPAAAAASERVSPTGSGALEDLPEGSAAKVKALREQLSQNGTVPLTGGVAQPTAPEPKPETPPMRRLSEHDRINNTNALELLQSGAFKLVPGKDSVPYEQLKTLRLEDGIDVTRKEEYLTADEFSTVFKMTQDAFKQLPQWKKLQLKKSSELF